MGKIVITIENPTDITETITDEAIVMKDNWIKMIQMIMMLTTTVEMMTFTVVTDTP